MTWSVRGALFLAALSGCASALSAGPASKALTNASLTASPWAKVKNERHGFAIAYPENVFEQTLPSKTDEGRAFLSKDGKAKLLVGAFVNESEATLKDYRRYLLEEQYAGADIDYAPVKRRWFVLSGTQGGEIFYQRVSFTCGGKLINSWAMLYPASDRKFYDRVVEAVAPTFTPGAGPSGACD